MKMFVRMGFTLCTTNWKLHSGDINTKKEGAQITAANMAAERWFPYKTENSRTCIDANYQQYFPPDKCLLLEVNLLLTLGPEYIAYVVSGIFEHRQNKRSRDLERTKSTRRWQRLFSITPIPRSAKDTELKSSSNNSAPPKLLRIF
jgi:hypothetical protein